jgi:hypothetical protein
MLAEVVWPGEGEITSFTVKHVERYSFYFPVAMASKLHSNAGSQLKVNVIE